MSLQDAYDDFFGAAARAPARAPATLPEIWQADWRASGLDTLTGAGQPFVDAYNELVGRVAETAGKPVPQLAQELGLPFRMNVGAVADIERVIDRLPADQREALAPYRDPLERARRKAAEIERQAAETAGRTYGLTGHAVAFAAGVARQAVDPVNLAATPLGGPLTGNVLRMLGREALIGAATQAAQEPFIQSARQTVRLDSGFGEAVGNIAEAGLGNAALAGLFRGGAHVVDRVRAARLGLDVETFRAGPEALQAERPQRAAPLEDWTKTQWMERDFRPDDQRLAGFDPADFHAAARLAERDALMDGSSVLTSPEGRLAHGDMLAAASRALEDGAPLPDPRAALAQIRALSPDVFQRAETLDARVAEAQAELDRFRTSPPVDERVTLIEARVRDIDARLDEIAGDRAARREGQGLVEEREALAADLRTLAADRGGHLSALENAARGDLAEARMERARLGPTVRAAFGDVDADPVARLAFNAFLRGDAPDASTGSADAILRAADEALKAEPPTAATPTAKTTKRPPAPKEDALASAPGPAAAPTAADMLRADVERELAARGGDARISTETGAETSARDLLKQVDDDRAALAALRDCALAPDEDAAP